MDNFLPELRYEEAMHRLNNNRTLYFSLLKKFNPKEMADRIAECLLSGKTDEAAAEAHKLKGAASNLALPLLAEAAQAIEKAMKDGLPLSGEPEELKRALSATVSKINMLLESGAGNG